MMQTHVNMTLYVESDHVLPDGDVETVEHEIGVTVTGTWCPAEPDVGYMHDWFEDVTATEADGRIVELTPAEEEGAQTKLAEARAADRAEAAEYRAELHRDALMEDRNG